MQTSKKRISSSSSNPADASHKLELIHSSFRIEEGVIKPLERIAEKRGISLSLVNKRLKDCVISEMNFEELGFIPVSKDFLRRLFSKMALGHLNTFDRDRMKCVDNIHELFKIA
jgi:hypothetical protein